MSFLFSQFRGSTAPTHIARVRAVKSREDEQEEDEETGIYRATPLRISPSIGSNRDVSRTPTRSHSNMERMNQSTETESALLLREENRRLRAEVERLGAAMWDRTNSKAEARRCSLLQQLLNQRTAELNEAQSYLNKLDDYPGSTILEMVEGLNSEIFNAATSINSLYERSGKMDLMEIGEKLEVFNHARIVAKAAIGEHLYSANCQIDEALGYADPSNPEEPLPLQLALQRILIQWCSHLLSGFGSSAVGQALDATYRIVRSIEEPSVSAKWRTITAAALRQQEENCIPGVADAIMAVLCICGISTVTEEFPKVKQKVATRLAYLEKMALKLRTAMLEGIASSDMEIISVDSDTPFDPPAMTDIFSGGRPSKKELGKGVLCTVGLGLRKATTRRANQGAMQEESFVMKLPEVVLISALQ
ncbi:hypothetical protein NLJ89_g7892 [Agrocybe chaxingu]|uniref:Uncharacterized protein n=1 Tax=Agrocybe chaxingu TaxID=84603 RepID=A0A9W8JWA5_9AGAR|nr:hypothetical protein NLJ89_g7892 [Agrocybe chaxingu]